MYITIFLKALICVVIQMVKIIFLNLLRSKYRIEETFVKSGTIKEIITQIIEKHPMMKIDDFRYAVFFYKGNVYHYTSQNKTIEDEEELKITHFVGGG